MDIEITDQYLKTAKIRRKKLQATCRARYDRAWDVARQAAGLLKETYHVSRVVVFGSLVASDQFHLRSDIDLAIWGIDDRDYYQAVGVLQSLDREITIDVIIYDEAKEYLQRAIDREGISI